MSATSSCSAPFVLPLARWFPANHAQLDEFLAAPDLAGRSAAFDWDNTCIHNDLGETAFRWQLDHMALALPPHLLAAQWNEPIDLLEGAGHSVQALRALLDAAMQAWTGLWPAVVRQQQQTVRHGPMHLDFRASLGLLYQSLAHADDGLPAVTASTFGLLARLWGGLPHGAPARAVEDILVAERRDHPKQSSWVAATQDANYSFAEGLRPFAEMRALMAALQSRGVEICVVSASFEPLVRALAEAWHYPVAAEDIYGLRLSDLTVAPPSAAPAFGLHLRADYPLTYRHGKVACLVRARRTAPVLVAGDALTDLEMLTHWPETRIRLLLHRPRAAAPIEALHRAATHPEAGHCTTLLQGRNEVVGEFWPRQWSGP